MQQSFSFKQQTYKRLKKNKGAVFGLCVIFITLFISLFGYIIAPDNSPNADLQTVEIQAKKLGYTQQFLKIYDDVNLPETSWLRKIIKGNKNI